MILNIGISSSTNSNSFVSETLKKNIIICLSLTTVIILLKQNITKKSEKNTNPSYSSINLFVRNMPDKS